MTQVDEESGAELREAEPSEAVQIEPEQIEAEQRRERSMSKKQIEDCVRSSLDGYFRDLRGTEPDGMYDMLVRVVEKPLLDVVMTRAEGNQSRAAQWLGLNRNTLRK